MPEDSEKRYAVRDSSENALISFDTEAEGIFWIVNHGYKYWCGNIWKNPDSDLRSDPYVHLSYQKSNTVKRMINDGILPRDVMLYPQ